MGRRRRGEGGELCRHRKRAFQKRKEEGFRSPAADAFLRNEVRGMGLLQSAHRSAEVQMKRLPADDERRNGFHSGGLGLGDAVLGGAEVDDLEVYLGVIEVARDRALGVETHGAAGVIEGSDGFAHGIFVCGGFLLCGEKRNASLNVNLTHPCARS